MRMTIKCLRTDQVIVDQQTKQTPNLAINEAMIKYVGEPCLIKPSLVGMHLAEFYYGQTKAQELRFNVDYGETVS